jgi:hypothetical protein
MSDKRAVQRREHTSKALCKLAGEGDWKDSQRREQSETRVDCERYNDRLANLRMVAQHCGHSKVK